MHSTDSLTTFDCAAKVQLQKRLIDNHFDALQPRVKKKETVVLPTSKNPWPY